MNTAFRDEVKKELNKDCREKHFWVAEFGPFICCEFYKPNGTNMTDKTGCFGNVTTTMNWQPG